MAGEAQMTVAEKRGLGYDILKQAGYDDKAISIILYHAFGLERVPEEEEDDVED